MKAFRLHAGIGVSILLLLTLLPLGKRSLANAGDDDHLQTGEFIPTGVHITPNAAKGSVFQPLNPDLPFDPSFVVGQAVTTAVSPDGKTLLILTSGYNSQNFTSGPNEGSANPAESSLYTTFPARLLSKLKFCKFPTPSTASPGTQTAVSSTFPADRTTPCTSS